MTPWHTVTVNSMGPWTIEMPTNEVTFRALTIIDAVTNPPEIVRLDDVSSFHAAQQFKNAWPVRFPQPVECMFNPGTEFKSHFQQTLAWHGIQAEPAAAKNLQANVICERLHQTVGNVLHTQQQL